MFPTAKNTSWKREGVLPLLFLITIPFLIPLQLVAVVAGNKPIISCADAVQDVLVRGGALLLRLSTREAQLKPS